MIDDLLLSHARRLWAELTGAPVVFGAGGVDVAVSPSSRLCPPGWVGIVALAGGAIATAPDEGGAEIVRRELGGRAAADVTEPGFVRDRLPVDDVLGPATLAYCDAECFRPSEAPRSETSDGTARPDRTAGCGVTAPSDRTAVSGTKAVSDTTAVSRGTAPSNRTAVPDMTAVSDTTAVSGGTAPFNRTADTDKTAVAGGTAPSNRTADPDTGAASDRTVPFSRVEQLVKTELASLVERVSADDAGEAGLDEITSAAFVVRSAGEIVAAAGYEVWPRGTAHLSVLVAPEYRGQGLAQAVASAAVADALRVGLVPQWRARPEASRRVARALGFREIGMQLSIRLRTAPA